MRQMTAMLAEQIDFAGIELHAMDADEPRAEQTEPLEARTSRTASRTINCNAS